MQYFDVFLALLAFAGLCLLFWRVFALPGGFTPLLSCSVIILVLTLAGIAGQLRLGGWLIYAVGLGAAVGVPVAAAAAPPKEKAGSAPRPPLADFAFIGFWAVCAVTAVVFALRKPVFAEWDELSFWGTASKLLKLNDALYTTASVGWDWVGAQQPGAVLCGYFFQFFGSFAPWKTFVGYDVLLFSAYAALVSGIDRPWLERRSGWRRYPLGVAAFLLCLISPFLLSEYCRILDVTNTYMSAYGDIPAGILAAGAAAWYFSLRQEDFSAPPCKSQTALPRGGLGVCLVFAAAGLIKENAFPVVLVAAGICAADLLFFRVRDGKFPALWRRLSAALGLPAAPVAAYLIWNRHVAAVVAARESAGQVGTTNLSVTQVVVLGVRQLLHPAERTALYNQVITDMVQAFFHTRLTLLGSLTRVVSDRLLGEDNPLSALTGTGLWIALTCTGLFLAAALLCPQKQLRRRTLSACALSLLGFIGYYWVLILSYAFIFKPSQAAVLSDYNRYLVSYYLFWFLLALACLTACAGFCPQPQESTPQKKPGRLTAGRKTALLTLFAIGVAGVGLLVTALYIQPQMTALAYPETTFTQQKAYAQTAQEIAAQIQSQPQEGTVFFVSTDDNGGKYFNYCYQLLPIQMDYSFGGGPIGSAAHDDGSLYYHAVSLAELRDYLTQRDCAYIFLEYFDSVFEEEYAALFSDGLAAAKQGTTRLYCRTQTGAGLCYSPVEEVTD